MKKTKFTVEMPTEFVKLCMARDNRKNKRWYGEELRHANNWFVGLVTEGITQQTTKFHEQQRMDEVWVSGAEEMEE